MSEPTQPQQSAKPEPRAGLSSLSRPKMILLASALLLLVASLLPWYSIDLGIASASASGWHGVGVLAWLFLLVLIALEVAALFGALPLDQARANLASLGAAAMTLLFGLIYVIVRLTDGYLGFGFFLGVLALVGLAVGAYLQYRESDARTALRNLQKPGTPPATPPNA